MPRPGKLSDSDRSHLLKDATRLARRIDRRAFIGGSLTLGGLAALTGLELTDSLSAEKLLARMSQFNDRVQAALFNPATRAPEFSEMEITRPFPFNAFYAANEAPEIDGSGWKLELTGRIARKRPWTLSDLRRLPRTSQITRLICIEGWSAIGKWSGPRLADLLRIVDADLTAKYVGFRCEDRYWTSIDMASALHPQTQLAIAFDGQTLPRQYGYPLRVRIPTKLGFKNPKHVYEIFVTNSYPGGYWENQGYNWFSGL